VCCIETICSRSKRREKTVNHHFGFLFFLLLLLLVSVLLGATSFLKIKKKNVSMGALVFYHPLGKKMAGPGSLRDAWRDNLTNLVL
jgi:hypothetical protein